jgi:hypothetical protein
MNLGAIAWLCAFGSDYRKNPSEMENFYMTWAQGFMSGMNVISLPQYRDLAAMSLDEQKSALRTYCDQHPLADYGIAVMYLYMKLPQKRHSQAQ